MMRAIDSIEDVCQTTLSGMIKYQFGENMTVELVFVVLGMIFILGGAAFAIPIVINKNNIRSYPLLNGVYAGLAIFLFSSGILIIYQITINLWITLILLITYFVIISRLPAKRQNIKIENKGF